MLIFICKRLVYTLPIMLGVAVVCFMLVHLAPGDPLVSVLPPDASENLQAAADDALRLRPSLLGAVLQVAVARRCRVTSAPPSAPIARSCSRSPRRCDNTLMLAALATVIGFVLGDAVRLRRRLFPRQLDRQARLRHLGRGRVGAALLARHGAGDRLRGNPGLAAADRRRARRLRGAGSGTGSTCAT